MTRRVFAATFILGLFGAFGVGVAGADTVFANFGSCFHAVGTTGDTSFVPDQAPGQSLNGPLTIVNTPSGSTIYSRGGFAGGEGCTH